MNAAPARRQVLARHDLERLRQKSNPFVVAAETSCLPIVFMDAISADRPIIFANDSFSKLTCYDVSELEYMVFSDLLADDPRNNSADGALEAAFQHSCQSTPELWFHRKDGSIFVASLSVSPVRDENGRVMKHLASLTDLTRHYQERERLQFLLDELHHRTHNLLATVQVIAAQTLRRVGEHDVAATLQDRILALSSAYTLLTTRASDRLTMYDVIGESFRLFGHSASGHWTYVGEEVRVPARIVLNLCLILHELASNALKHGALSGEPRGLVHIEWHADGGSVTLQWREIGGPPVGEPSGTGFGKRLIEEGLAMDAGGSAKLDFAPEGVRCRITLDLTAGPGAYSIV